MVSLKVLVAGEVTKNCKNGNEKPQLGYRVLKKSVTLLFICNNMTVAQERLQTLAEDTRMAINLWFGDVATFYAFFYTLTQKEHIIDQEKPAGWQEQLKAAQYYRRLCAKRAQKECGLPDELLEDIYSDYFEDFANYRDKKLMDDKLFMSYLRKLIS